MSHTLISVKHWDFGRLVRPGLPPPTLGRLIRGWGGDGLHPQGRPIRGAGGLDPRDAQVGGQGGGLAPLPPNVG